MFRIANGIVRSPNWNGDTSKDSEIEDQYKSNSDYECLQANVDACKKDFDYPEYETIPAINQWIDAGIRKYEDGEPRPPKCPIRTTIVIIGDDGYYGVGITPGIVIARVKEEEVALHS